MELSPNEIIGGLTAIIGVVGSVLFKSHMTRRAELLKKKEDEVDARDKRLAVLEKEVTEIKVKQIDETRTRQIVDEVLEPLRASQDRMEGDLKEIMTNSTKTSLLLADVLGQLKATGREAGRDSN